MRNLKLNGLNILARNNIDQRKIVDYHRAVQPAVSLVLLEPGLITTLRAVSPSTLYIYRHYPDDSVYDKYTPEEFVEMMHRVAPPGAALYLGNEPGNFELAAAWSVRALDACDRVGRVGVVLNLSYWNPKPEDWGGVFLKLLQRLRGTHHIIGLHEYWHRRDLGLGQWVGRFKSLYDTTRRLGMPDPQVVITELGTCDNGNAQRGWLKFMLTSSSYWADIKRCLEEVYLPYPKVLGVNVFAYGDWDGFEIQHDNYLMDQLTGWVPPTVQENTGGIVIPQPVRQPVLIIASVQGLAAPWNIRSGPGTEFGLASPVSQLANGDVVTLNLSTLQDDKSHTWKWVQLTRHGDHQDAYTGYVALLDNPPPGYMSTYLKQAPITSTPGGELQVVGREDLSLVIDTLSEWQRKLYGVEPVIP